MTSLLTRCTRTFLRRSFYLRKNPTRFFARVSFLYSKSMKVSILGAASRTGNCLSLLLKRSPLIDEIAIYDSEPIRGIALDLSYIDTECKISNCTNEEAGLEEILQDAKIVAIVPSELPRNRLTKEDLLKINGDVLSNLLSNVIRFCPQAMVAIAMNPINSLIPLATEMYKRAGIFDYGRLFGVTTLDCVRANTFMADTLGIGPENILVPVIGGSCPNTRIPVFSQAKPCNKLSPEEISRLTSMVRAADEEIWKINEKETSSSFALGFAAARFCISLCKALRHRTGIIEYAYVRSCVIPEVTYFATPLELGSDGIQNYLGIPPLSNNECKLLEEAIPVLNTAIKRGEALALGTDVVSTESCP